MSLLYRFIVGPTACLTNQRQVAK